MHGAMRQWAIWVAADVWLAVIHEGYDHKGGAHAMLGALHAMPWAWVGCGLDLGVAVPCDESCS